MLRERTCDWQGGAGLALRRGRSAGRLLRCHRRVQAPSSLRKSIKSGWASGLRDGGGALVRTRAGDFRESNDAPPVQQTRRARGPQVEVYRMRAAL